MLLIRTLALLALILSFRAAIGAAARGEEPVVYQTDYENGATDWRPTDPAAWRVIESDDGHVYSQFKKQSDYQPPHRSPFNISLLEGASVGDFTLDVRVLSTHEDYGHRDACVVFGYQDPAHFYYVHFGKETDDHANQIFIVNDKPRVKISTKTSSGTPWDDKWHHVRIVRRVDEGLIEVFFDDMETPVMTATDKTFAHGRIGIGTFDDTSDWDDLVLRGERKP
jgi:hypothetical protein